MLPVCGTTKVRTCYYCFCERKGHLSSHGKKSSEPISTLFCVLPKNRDMSKVFFLHICLCFDNREDCYSQRHSTNSALFFSQLLAHCFNVDFSWHPKIIDKLRTIQVILESVSDNSVKYATHFCNLTNFLYWYIISANDLTT